jgi:hypothetical protein
MVTITFGISEVVSLLDQNGSVLTRFTEKDGKQAPSGTMLWSRSKSYAVVTFHPPAGPASSFLIIDHDGNRLSELRRARFYPMWSPTQDLLAYLSLDNRLYVVDQKGTPLQVSEPFEPRLCEFCGTAPMWSPGGTQVALAVNIGDVAIPKDAVVCLLGLDGKISYISLMDYRWDGLSLWWLDESHLLVQCDHNSRVYRYLLIDAETGAMRVISSSADLMPAPMP